MEHKIRQRTRYTKRSYGIVCLRYIGKRKFGPKKSYNMGKLRQGWQVLMIQRGSTHAFYNFAYGQIDLTNDMAIKQALGRMTCTERTLIHSLDFRNIWMSIYPLANETDDKYIRKGKLFDSIFLRDGGKRLRFLIRTTRPASPIWEVSKGGKDKKNKKETDIQTAIREFKEETGSEINKDYDLIDGGKKRIVLRREVGRVTYEETYFVARSLRVEWIPNPPPGTGEVAGIEWVCRTRMRFLNYGQPRRDLVCKLFNIAISYIKSIKYKKPGRKKMLLTTPKVRRLGVSKSHSSPSLLLQKSQ